MNSTDRRRALKRIDVLKRRAAHLERRCAAKLREGFPEDQLSYDRAEIAALKWAVDSLSAVVNSMQKESDDGPGTT